MWQLRLGLNKGGDIVGLGMPGHGTCMAHGRKEVQGKHPEYFALWGTRAIGNSHGRSHYGKPCLSAKGLFEDNVKMVRAIFDTYDEPTVSVMPADGYTSLCRCELCKGKSTPDRGWNGKLSDYVWGYVNNVAKELYKSHPDKKILCFAYGAYYLPPEKITRLSPNIVVGFCRWRSLLNDSEKFERFKKICDQWLAKLPSKEILVWDYYLHGRPGRTWEGIPAVFPHLIAKDLRYLKGISTGDFIEIWREPKGSRVNALATNHLNMYVTARLYWDADQDLSAMLDKYYKLFYGPAAGQMKQYFEFCEANWTVMKNKPELIDKSIKLLNAAQKVAGDSAYGKRIKLIDDYHTDALKKIKTKLAKDGEKNVPKRKNVPKVIIPESNKNDITIDGKGNDKFWKGLPVYQLKDAKSGKVPQAKTSFQIGYAENNLYFLVRCEEPDMKNLKIEAEHHDQSSIWFGDTVELLLETHTHSYYQITITPEGVIADLNRGNKRVFLAWASGAEVATRKDVDSWTVEIKIPLAGEMAKDVDPRNGVAGSKPTEESPWFFNVCRQRIRNSKKELSTFNPTRRESFHRLNKFAKLVVK